MARTVGLVFDNAGKPDKNDLVYECVVCGKKYKTAAGLENHGKKEHPDLGALENDTLDLQDFDDEDEDPPIDE
ncbi:Putative transcriptional repressor regulating G2/M transition [Anaerotruncus sp. 2789STDY5834896]|uniref:Putative transcriptional repressor regulating G2/M transition n=1 Tax=uncultured Anaerotruncus sp. TaxID=905011 RepID=A0A1C6I7R0_9FIRM|nr:Putative transcriptional repressor regulating G2/M transition [uncultured Anaerotruncus sp.]